MTRFTRSHSDRPTDDARLASHPPIIVTPSKTQDILAIDCRTGPMRILNNLSLVMILHHINARVRIQQMLHFNY